MLIPDKCSKSNVLLLTSQRRAMLGDMDEDADFPAYEVDTHGVAVAMEAAIEALGAAAELMGLNPDGCRELAHSVPQLPQVIQRIEEAALFFKTTAKFCLSAAERGKVGIELTKGSH